MTTASNSYSYATTGLNMTTVSDSYSYATTGLLEGTKSSMTD